MTSEKFETEYGRLNPQQKQAVDAIEGPVMVVAGPGTGKTQVLTLRIANILQQTDTAPESILALTFTESAAASMRTRLASIIGTPAYGVRIETFHGFCNDLIGRYPDAFPAIISAEPVGEIQRVQILEKLISQLPLAILKPAGNPAYYLRSIASRVSQLKREGVSTDEFAGVVNKELERFSKIGDLCHESGPHKGKMKGAYIDLQKQINKNSELSIIYSAYQKELLRARLYDYEDMIMEALCALSQNSDLLLRLQEQHQYLLVDEHQDTNNAQNKILELLCDFHASPNLFIVGDEKQAIYRFQGASLANFLYFKKKYPAALVVALRNNYRSNQFILDAIESLIASPSALRASQNLPSAKVVVTAYKNEADELPGVAREIEANIVAGVAPHEIAVLCRENGDAQGVVAALERRSIKCALLSDQDTLTDVEIKKLLLLLRAVGSYGVDAHFVEAIHVNFLGIEPLDIYKLIAARGRNQSFYDLAANSVLLAKVGVINAAPIITFARNLSVWARAAKNCTVLESIETIVRESGFLAHLLKSNHGAELFRKFDKFFDEAKSYAVQKNATFSGFLAHIDSALSHNLSLGTADASTQQGRVRVLTAHKAKGMEFEYVYMIYGRDGHWGGRRSRELLPLLPSTFALGGVTPEEDAEDAEERRIFYVALSRAKRRVSVSYAKTSGRSESLPAKFISEIAPEFIDLREAVANKDGTSPAEKFAPRVSSGPSVGEREFIAAKFEENGLSVTALNNYLECPWKFFYNNLLRVPQAPQLHLLYGTAIHAALKDFMDLYKESVPTKEFLLSRFETHLKEQRLLPEVEFDNLLGRGKKSLSGYYDAMAAQTGWKKAAFSEFTVNGVLVGANIRLTGKIDKIEDGADGFHVVDYKTGHFKSRREIAGETMDSSGAMLRQLVFYKLLLEKHFNGMEKVATGEIDFIEPDDRGRHRNEKFELTSAAVNELETQIIQVAKEIREAAFWDKGCGEKDCDACQLRITIK